MVPLKDCVRHHSETHLHGLGRVRVSGWKYVVDALGPF